MSTNTLPKVSLVDGLTQSAKTWKVFELFKQHLSVLTSTLVLIISQANSTTAANQLVARAKKDEEVSKLFGKIQRATEFTKSRKNQEHTGEDNFTVTKKNGLFVDFWNSKNILNMIDIVESFKWRMIVIVIDEADQGDFNGLSARIDIIRKIERWSKIPVKLIFITATVANLTKNICKIAQTSPSKYRTGIIHEILFTSCVAHFFVIPHDNYIGPSWFMNGNPRSWRQLILRKKLKTETNKDFRKYKNQCVYNHLKNLSDYHKELCLVVSSTVTEDHADLSKMLFEADFDVVVELNSSNSKNFNVSYRDKESQTIKFWSIPYVDLANLADKQKLTHYRNRRTNLKTTIYSKHDLSLPYILQSCLFMGTEYDERIERNVHHDDFVNLLALQNAACTMVSSPRPHEYPDNPKVALIAGHLAGRGITIQNAALDFVCTSFCFAGVEDVKQRGAQNAQRFGRACGMLHEVFIEKQREPVLIASPDVLRDACLNESCLLQKAKDISDGQLLSLKSFISDECWDQLKKYTNITIQQTYDRERRSDTTSLSSSDGASTSAIESNNRHIDEDVFNESYLKMTPLYKRIITILSENSDGLGVKDLRDSDQEVSDILVSQHNSPLFNLSRNLKLIENNFGKWKLTELGNKYSRYFCS